MGKIGKDPRKSKQLRGLQTLLLGQSHVQCHHREALLLGPHEEQVQVIVPGSIQ